jgi:outer membrane receptor protein involved in Fe transport
MLGPFSALATAIAAALPAAVWSQDAPGGVDPPAIEEVVTTYRLLTAAESLVTERINLPFSADFLGSDVIARAGDADIAAALRRVPGLTLVDGKFVYVRGLGERYSSVTVNGAAVPSPDLTRSVIPLDLFPTSIVESIKIQKSPSPDQPAAFGGGAIDIRTRSVPQDLVASFSVGLGYNNENSNDGLVYPKGGRQMPQPIVSAINSYRGDISISNILNTLNAAGGGTAADARTIHQGLINSLDTNVHSRFASLDPDRDAKLALGNAWEVGDDWRFGLLFNATYNEQYRNQNQHREGIGNPDTNFLDIDKTVFEESSVTSLNLGLDYLDDHSFEVSSYTLRTDDSEASISRGFDQNNQFPDQKVNYSTRLEERELQLTQISGDHRFADTPLFRKLVKSDTLSFLEFDWFYSDSTATTGIPNETDFQASALLDDAGRELSTQLLATTSSGSFSFLDLEDDHSSWGGNLSLPIEGENTYWTLSGGWWGSKKTRDYAGYNINMNSVGVQSSILSGAPGDVLTPANLTVDNGFDISLGSQFGTESYIAAQKVDAGYGMVDAEFGLKWRFTAGARYESYQHAVMPLDLLDFSGVSIVNLQNELLDPNQTLLVTEDDIFPSMAVTRMGDGLLGSEQFQIRLSYGETVVRPDLREVADIVYLDPELDIRVRGNSALRSSPINNIELRTEFYYGSGDNFTVSLFYKDIQAPIERIRSAGSDDDVVLGFTNAESGELYGIEFEGLKRLWRGLFLAGNVTLSDSKLQFSPGLSSDLTNLERRLTGHSEWVFNATLGFDSDNGKHSTFLNYNAFGDRIFFAGTGLNEDAYEKPFNSLGIVYKYFPSDRLEVNFKIDNILDEKNEFEQVSSTGRTARIISQNIGTSFSLSGRWAF